MGALAFIAMSCSFVIFNAWVSDNDPPNTVKSFANTKVLRPLTVPQPVTTPSPGTLVFSMPNSVERCSTNMSNSSNEPLSSNSSMRSRAVNLPRACCASMRFTPPPSLAPARRSSRVSRMSFIGFRPSFFATILVVLTGCSANQKLLSVTFRRYKGLKSGRFGRPPMSEAQEQELVQETGVVTGGVNIILRLEGLTLFAGMVLLYAMWGGSWWIFGVLFLVPDLSFAAYLADARTGAIVYNAAHCYMLPVALMTAGFLLPD